METKTTTKKSATEVPALEAAVYSQTGAKAGTIALPAAVFGVKWNASLVHQVAISMMANARAGTAHTKDRSEVSGGGKKPWKQKGTGRARHGSSRSPIWVGGGVTFGPRSDKDYSKKINKKMRTKALFTALSKKFADNRVLFLDAIKLGAIKTKDAAAVLQKISGISGFEKLATKKKTAGLVVLAEHNEVVERSLANIPSVTVVLAPELNVVQVLKYNSIIFVSEAVVTALAAKLK